MWYGTFFSQYPGKYLFMCVLIVANRQFKHNWLCSCHKLLCNQDWLLMLIFLRLRKWLFLWTRRRVYLFLTLIWLTSIKNELIVLNSLTAKSYEFLIFPLSINAFSSRQVAQSLLRIHYYYYWCNAIFSQRKTKEICASNKRIYVARNLGACHLYPDLNLF